MSESTQKLNAKQLVAVTHTDGPLLIVAGAGTGKTTVLINRLLYLITEKGLSTDEILLTTFTEKAVGELTERADRLLPYGYTDLWIYTFHGLCERLLREHALDIGLNPDFKLLNTTEQWVLIKKNLDKFNLEYYRPLGNPTKFISELIKHFSRLKDEDISTRDYLNYVNGLDANVGAKKSAGKINEKLKTKIKSVKKEVGEGEDGEEAEEMEAERVKELAESFFVYQQLLLDNNFLDFGDLIIYTLKLFRERPNILKFYQEKFKYIMVDEFQDTNFAQYELMKLLAAGHGNLVVVGDDDQCLPGETLVLTEGGQKRIDKVKIGEKVASAVGKGYLSHSPVSFVNQTKKLVKLLTFTTEKGNKITVTDNHKMFSFLQTKNSNKSLCYVYLMYKQGLGWRIGITNDLNTRLRLERSADKILALCAFDSEAEARYHELLWSLKYSIPTVCFKERDGLVIVRDFVTRLYEELDITSSVIKLTNDLNIDLEAAQFSLGGVNRGSKVRIKINLEMCQRNYRSKGAKGIFLQSPKVNHLLRIETTDKKTIESLKKLGFDLTKAKKGWRLRMDSADLKYLGKIAKKIEREIRGIVEVSMNLGKVNYQHKKSLVIPAKNVLPGMFLPVVTEKGIIYERIVSRTEKDKNILVYDLEVERTHNFVANNIVVHNSVYKFRGASISNIMQFKDDYPKAKEILLTDNYRSNQEILDYAYTFIQNNNPNRLEAKLKIDKKIVARKEEVKKDSAKKEPSKQEPAVKFLQFNNDLEETSFISQRIKDLYQASKDVTWSDFAILVRANSTADKFVKELTRQNIPHEFVSLRGLYYKPIILDCLAYLKLLDNYHESSALFRVLNMEAFKVSHVDLITINKHARRKVWSLYETLSNISEVADISAESINSIDKLLILINKHSVLVAKEKTSKIFLELVKDAELIKNLDRDRDVKIYSYLNQFYRKIKKIEEADLDLKLKDFMELINLELEAGESGSLARDFEDSEVVKIMTVHAAKGLEFKYVFLPNLVDKQFPTINRGEKISLPDALVKEKIISDKDIHLEEERRLFYVALTRAKDELYLSAAKDYGGVKEKRPSKFLQEMGLEITSSGAAEIEASDLMRDLGETARPLEQVAKISLPAKFSFSQFAAYASCPLQYKFAFILKIPAATKNQFIFGQLIHHSLYEFLLPFLNGAQGTLFNDKKPLVLKKKDLLDIYHNNFTPDNWETSEDRDKYKIEGEKNLNLLFDNYLGLDVPNILCLEKSFTIKINNEVVKGTIDRIDRLSDGTYEIADYKTGNPKEKLAYEDKKQLLLYQIVAEELLGLKISSLAFYYLRDGSKAAFVAKDKELEKFKLEIREIIKEIKAYNFVPKPEEHVCKFCDFNSICEFRKG